VHLFFPRQPIDFLLVEKKFFFLIKKKFITFEIDFGAIWCEALCNIIDALPNTTSFTSV
jgi:hypothetical protein